MIGFWNAIAAGFALGGVYALLAIGFALPFGACGILHLAYGAVVACAVYTFFAVTAGLGLPIAAAVVTAAVVSVGASIGLYRFVYSSLRRRQASSLVVFMASLAVLILSENLLQIGFGPDVRLFPYGSSWGALTWANVTVTKVDLAALAVSIVAMAGVAAFIRGTRLGRSIRALASNRDLSGLIGIDVVRTEYVIFIISGLLCVPAGLLVAVRSSFYPTMGFDIVFLAAVAAIIGGIGNFTGAILGGFTLGLIQGIASWMLPSEWSQAVTFGLLTVTLILRPAGLLGRTRLRAA